MSDSEKQPMGEHAVATAWISILLIALFVAVSLTFVLEMHHSAMERISPSAAT